MNDLKNRVRYTTTVNKELLVEFRNLSKDTRIPQSKLIDEAITLILNKYVHNN
ncbi:ribbon-helix-helix domain-containing protein [Bacillus coagulans]|uniref:ribbon-helix-helix domain-containing protein n=1 Tax=Heyndrickxia coagulans TaxID=1398 RepID=UPI001379015D|nr:ribbon-helix-helix domain-containing protein [Heyndrickxia coagulans]NCG67124.1 ribbon-helix-helix domain-containing protein [Heyndrickxia coagulans]